MRAAIVDLRYFIAVFIVMGLAGGTASGATSGGCTSAQCHSAMAQSPVHPKELDCAQYHEPVSAQHPQAGNKTFKLTKEDVCSRCHVDSTAHKNMHAPVAAKECMTCHDPHGESTGKYLAKKEIDLCLACHAGVLNKDAKFLHGPIQKGECSACHNPHGSAYEKLLIAEYSTKIYVGYSEEEYQLCFSCHDRLMLQFPDTSFATGFRNGEQNLHYLHVNRPHRGRNCKLCHAIHDSNLSKLIAATAPFGSWEAPLNFKMTPTGGSCSPGCHKTEAYDRERPLRK